MPLPSAVASIRRSSQGAQRIPQPLALKHAFAEFHFIPSWLPAMFGAGLVTLAANAVCAQNFPLKPIRILAAEAGSGSDLAARIIAQGLAATFAQAVIVDNRGGAVIVAPLLARSNPDGYTLLFHGSPIWLTPYMMNNAPWDPLKDFAPIAWAASSPNVLVVHPAVTAKSAKELITLAKSKPGELNYSAGGPGSVPHLAAELFKALAGINVVRVSYKGTGPALNALSTGEVQMMIGPSGSVVPQIRAGRVRALAVGSAQPSALVPELPTVAASGLPGYESVAMTGLLAPARTPAAVVNHLNRQTAKVLERPDVKEKFLNASVEVIGGSPAQFTAAIKAEMLRMGKVIKDAGIHE